MRAGPLRVRCGVVLAASERSQVPRVAPSTACSDGGLLRRRLRPVRLVARWRGSVGTAAVHIDARGGPVDSGEAACPGGGVAETVFVGRRGTEAMDGGGWR